MVVEQHQDESARYTRLDLSYHTKGSMFDSANSSDGSAYDDVANDVVLAQHLDAVLCYLAVVVWGKRKPGAGLDGGWRVSAHHTSTSPHTSVN